ncbi:MAG TPA: EF-hand domain-containing protein [Sphingomicrobium sp.]
MFSAPDRSLPVLAEQGRRDTLATRGTARTHGGSGARCAELPSTPPEATPKSREEKRFSRADKDKNGRIEREELLASRRKAFAKLDKNGNGSLSFEEWAVKTITSSRAPTRTAPGGSTHPNMRPRRSSAEEKALFVLILS